LQAFAALRADDPAAAVRAFNAALAAVRTAAPSAGRVAPQAAAPASKVGASSTASAAAAASAATGGLSSSAGAVATGEEAVASGTEAIAADAVDDGSASVERERRELTEGLWRARILAGDADQPLAEARAVLERDDTAENRLEYAMVLLAAQRNEAARAELSLLTRSKETRPMALRMLGLVDFQDGKLDDASTRFADLVTTGKYLDDALYYLGMIAERHGDMERALRLYAQVQSGDNALAALLRAATILQGHGAAPAADELLDQLLIDEPQRVPEILAARARIYADAGDIPKGIAVLDHGELQYPDSVELRYARASMAEEAGHLAAALQELKEVARLRPADPAALNAYGYTLADHNRHLQAARKLIEEAHAAAPKSAAILDSLGWVLYRQGHGAEALTYLHEAYADDRGGDIAAHLGEVLWQQGQRDEAKRVWTEAARTDTDNTLLKATRQRLNAAN
jgi:tetratricopeptide (TPR) repeat protein